MPTPPDTTERALLIVVTLLALAALALTLLVPGFSRDNALVYGRF